MSTETKTCNNCRIEFPKTKKYFHRKIIKQRTKKGDVEYKSFRSDCITCYNKKIAEFKRKEYWRNPIESRKKAKTKRLNNPEMHREQVKKWRLNNPEKIKAKDLKRRKDLTDSCIAYSIGIPTNLIPKEVIETKRLIIKLKRQLKL